MGPSPVAHHPWLLVAGAKAGDGTARGQESYDAKELLTYFL
jgi:hypothetical protein